MLVVYCGLMLEVYFGFMPTVYFGLMLDVYFGFWLIGMFCPKESVVEKRSSIRLANFMSQFIVIRIVTE